MNLRDPFKAPALVSVPSSDESPPGDDLPPCQWLLPVPEDAERGTKPEKCGEPAPFQVRVKDAVSDALVDVCARHKAEHHERAANLRHQGKRPRRKAS